MAIAPDRVEPVFGDALAGDGGMTEPVSTGPRRDGSFDVFPDALSALPLPALTFVVPPEAGGGGVPAALPGMPGLPGSPIGLTGAPARATARTRPPAPRAPGTAAAPRLAPPIGAARSGFPPPGQPFAVAAPAPGTGRRPVAGTGYTPPVRTASSVVRPPAYLPQNQGLAGLRAAVQQARGGGRTPASPPSAVRPAPPTGARRRNGASTAWALLIFVLLFLVGSGVGQNIFDAISRLLHHR